MKLVLTAAGHQAELVRVPDQSVPTDLQLTRTLTQHVLHPSRKANELLALAG